MRVSATRALLGAVWAMFSVTLVAQRAAPAGPRATTPAEQRIEGAQKAIATNPKLAQPYNDLALALSRRARETGDPEYYNRADKALDTALSIEPGNLEARKLQIWMMLGRHEFGGAREAAV